MKENYTIKSQRLLKIENGKHLYEMVIQVDAEDEIPNPPPDYFAVGSMCQIADTHQYRLLNSEREWV